MRFTKGPVHPAWKKTMSDVHFASRHEFETLVQTLVATDVKGSFGKLHIVTITHDVDSSEWERLFPKAVVIAEKIIASHLRPEDTCLALEPGKYMIIFPGLTEAEGTMHAAAISQEIKARLFGQAKYGLGVDTQILPLSRLKTRPPALAVDSMDQVLDRHEAHSGPKLDTVFQPIWDAGHEAIIGNRVIIARRFEGRDLYEHHVLFAGDQDPLAAAVNQTLRELAAAVPPKRGALFVPQMINDHAFCDDNAAAAAVEMITKARQDTVVIELSGDLGNMAHPRLRDIIAAIRSRGAFVAARLLPEPETARFLRECGVDFLCFNEVQATDAGFTHSALYAVFTVLGHQVGGLGFKMCLWNTSSAEDVKRAAAQGFGLFSGIPIGPPQATTVKPVPWPARKVYI